MAVLGVVVQTDCFEEELGYILLVASEVELVVSTSGVELVVSTSGAELVANTSGVVE